MQMFPIHLLEDILFRIANSPDKIAILSLKLGHDQYLLYSQLGDITEALDTLYL